VAALFQFSRLVVSTARRNPFTGRISPLFYWTPRRIRRKILGMPRITTIDYDKADSSAREIFDHFKKERGNVPNMFRTVAYRPEILRTMITHFRAVMETGTVGVKLKELVIVRTSQINHCEYCLASHSQLALRHGWSEEQITDLANFRTRTDFSEREKAALELAERETLDSNGIDDEFWARLRQHFDEGEIIELAAAVGLFNYFNRFNNSLRMEPTK
jgi:uncharacterized peroxidase-related enzyme